MRFPILLGFYRETRGDTGYRGRTKGHGGWGERVVRKGVPKMACYQCGEENGGIHGDKRGLTVFARFSHLVLTRKHQTRFLFLGVALL